MTKENQKKLVLVDGSSYLFRAYHALPPLTTSKGQPTGAAYGVISMLRKLLAEEKPDFIGVIFDTKSKNFRHELYPAYKANRPDMPEELSSQIRPLHNMIRAMGLPLVAIEGVEADDVIGSLAHLATKQHIKTLISTSDKDLAQLVDHNIHLVNTMTDNRLDEKGVLEKFGVTPAQIVDYLTLIGDPIDNIPGIPKVGPKTAAKWLQEYNSLDEIIKHANDIKGKVGEYLRAHLDNLSLGKKLVTVQKDMKLPITVQELTLKLQDNEKLKALFQEMEFKSWLKDFDKTKEKVQEPQKGHYEILLEEKTFLVWLSYLEKAKQFALHSQTNSFDPIQGELVGLSFAVQKGKAAYVPLMHRYMDCPPQLSREWVLEKLKPVLESTKINKIGQNIKQVMHAFARYGIILQNVQEDTMLQSYVYNSIQKHNLDNIAQNYLNFQTPNYEDVAGKGAKQISFDQVPILNACEYAAKNADVILQVEKTLSEKLQETPNLNQVYRDIELPLVEVLWQMEEHGILIDADKLAAQSKQIAIELKALEEKAFVLAEQDFNLGSPKQLQEILYDKLQLPILERTPKGAPSTAESALQELSLDYELPRIILTHRSLSKLKSTYIDKLPLQINPNTGRIHTSYHQAITATGRLASSDPNLQNIPVRSQEGRKIRQAFIADKDYVLISADYSQIELRIMAHLSQDESLLAAFCANQDIHRVTSSEIFGIALDKVTPVQRRSAKAINFGLIYGMSAYGLSRQLDIDQKAAKAYMDLYFHRYPGVKRYMDNIREQAEELGYVETLFGRRLYLPDIRSKHMGRRKAAQRTAINAPMQGTAADIIKKAMVALHTLLKKQKDMKMLLQVHDELVLEVKKDVLDKAKKLISNCMQHTVTLSVPLIVDIGVGNNWDEAHGL